VVTNHLKQQVQQIPKMLVYQTCRTTDTLVYQTCRTTDMLVYQTCRTTDMLVYQTCQTIDMFQHEWFLNHKWDTLWMPMYIPYSTAFSHMKLEVKCKKSILIWNINKGRNDYCSNYGTRKELLLSCCKRVMYINTDSNMFYPPKKTAGTVP